MLINCGTNLNDQPASQQPASQAGSQQPASQPASQLASQQPACSPLFKARKKSSRGDNSFCSVLNLNIVTSRNVSRGNVSVFKAIHVRTDLYQQGGSAISFCCDTYYTKPKPLQEMWR